ncbi:MAG: 4Fe-4S dicluster domain-containing protein [Deltaproteobacteria bacterium]|nr:4Fe-4S dicluster domain-containing protein [Deltaproteobacteria bacterium]
MLTKCSTFNENLIFKTRSYTVPMIFVRIRKGYNLKIEGKPSLETDTIAPPSHVAVLPERIPFIKPRLQVEIGDHVNVGSLLFEDKRNSDLKFLAPGGGEVVQINFGPRRIIQEIVIRLDTDEKYEKFEAFDENKLEKTDRKQLIKLIMAGGLWPLIRELPFRDIAGPDDRPPVIFVNLDDQESFQPLAEVYLKGKRDLFDYGIKVLHKLGNGNVYISACRDHSGVIKELNGRVTHTYSGNYPADDPGVLLYYTKRSSDDNRSWYINGQDVLLLAHLLKTGTYPTERTVVLAGSFARERLHIRTRMGVPLAHMAQGRADKAQTRYLVGGIFRGYSGSERSYLGFYETSLTLMPEGEEREVLAFIRPGFNKPSYSKTFLSFFTKTDLRLDCNLHGGERACIGCGYCVDVCPVDILPQLTFKSIFAQEIDESLAHGLLDCVECGLCSYVCPSKIELAATLKEAKAEYYKQIS